MRAIVAIELFPREARRFGGELAGVRWAGDSRAVGSPATPGADKLCGRWHVRDATLPPRR